MEAVRSHKLLVVLVGVVGALVLLTYGPRRVHEGPTSKTTTVITVSASGEVTRVGSTHLVESSEPRLGTLLASVVLAAAPIVWLSADGLQRARRDRVRARP